MIKILNVPQFGTTAVYLCIINRKKQNFEAMKNTDFNLDSISSMISSELSYLSLVDMIKDLDLELLDVTVG